MLFHELRGLPVAQFAFGGSCAPFRFGSFRGKFFQLFVAVNDSFRVRSGMRIGWRALSGVRKRPLQRAVHDQVRIAANRRSKVRVFVEAQRKVAKRVRGVTRLFERSQHQIGNNALFRLPDKFPQQALIMLRRDPHFFGTR